MTLYKTTLSRSGATLSRRLGSVSFHLRRPQDQKEFRTTNPLGAESHLTIIFDDARSNSPSTARLSLAETKALARFVTLNYKAWNRKNFVGYAR